MHAEPPRSRSGLRILAQRERPPACPLCRVLLVEEDEVETCEGCGVCYHGDCLHELGGCGTLGCSLRGQVLEEEGEGDVLDDIWAALQRRAEEDDETYEAGPPVPIDPALIAERERLAREHRATVRASFQRSLRAAQREALPVVSRSVLRDSAIAVLMIASLICTSMGFVWGLHGLAVGTALTLACGVAFLVHNEQLRRVRLRGEARRLEALIADLDRCDALAAGSEDGSEA